MAISLSIMEHTDIIHFPIQQQNRLISRGGSRLLSLLDFSGSLQVINVYCSLSLLVLEGWPTLASKIESLRSGFVGVFLPD